MVSEIKKKKSETLDHIYDGRLALLQPAHGYRLSSDALLLTWFICGGRPARDVADLGCGCGIVALGLLLAGYAGRVTGIEIQPGLSDLAARNAALNDMSFSFEVRTKDIRACDRREDGAFDLVAANPPFWPADATRSPAEAQRRIACHEIHGDILDWAAAAARLLNGKRGRFALVYPARRLGALFDALRRARLYASRLRVVYPKGDGVGELVLVEARPGDRGQLDIEPSIVLKEAGVDTPLASDIYTGRFSASLRALADRRAP